MASQRQIEVSVRDVAVGAIGSEPHVGRVGAPGEIALVTQHRVVGVGPPQPRNDTVFELVSEQMRGTVPRRDGPGRPEGPVAGRGDPGQPGGAEVSSPEKARSDGAQIDVMTADRLHAHLQQRAMGHKVFAVPAGTSALRTTVSCVVDPGDGTEHARFSMPDVLGALVLKGAAYKADSRERERHLDDAALLACAMDDPEVEKPRLEGSDRGRIQMLYAELEDPSHRSWLAVGDARRTHGHDCLRILSANSQTASPRKGLGRKHGR